MSQPAATKVLFYGFRYPNQQRALSELLEEYPIDLVGIIERDNYLGELTDVFIKGSHLRRENYFHTHPHYTLPSEDIIENMRNCEAQVLKMMDRCKRYPKNKSTQYSYRKKKYLAQLTVAYNILQDHGFNHIIYSNIPHEPFEYTLHCLCKVMGIRTSFFWQLPLKGYFLHSESIEEIYTPFTVTQGDLTTKASTSLPAPLQKEIESRLENQAPWYMKKTPEPILKKIKKGLKQLRIRKIKPSIPGWQAYRKIKTISPPTDQKFVYFGLHLQPEATTSPMGGVWVDQFYAIIMLARGIPDDMIVLVKENPKQKYFRRYPEFYNILRNEPKVEFVSKEENTFQLIEQAVAVSTITGTLGWEGLFKKKPVFLFGQSFYESLPGIIKINEQKDVSEGIQQILSNKFTDCHLDQLKTLLLHIHNTAYHGIMDYDYFADTSITPNENNQLLKKAFYNALFN